MLPKADDLLGDDRDFASLPSAEGPIPFESVPQLAANEEFVTLMEKARHNKAEIERMEKEQEAIRIELGALAAVAGVKSVAYLDLVLTNVDGSTVKGKITGARLIEQCESNGLQAPLRAIALAAKDCDPDALVQHGYPPHLIEPAREPGKPRAGSTQFSWAGGKGKGGRRRAAGSGGAVQ